MANTLKFGNGEWYGKKDTILAYNDENNNYKPLPFDFSRASSATRVNKEGLIEVVSNNEPRIDFKDSSEGALLLEPSRTNKLTTSQDFSSFIKSGTVTTTTNYGISPSGQTDSTRVVFSSSNNGFYKLSVHSGNTETNSIYLKGTAGETIKFGKAAGVNGGDIFTLNGEWQRLDFVSTTGNQFTINTYTSVTARDIEIWGAQVEEGSYATSYIPTSGSAVTRIADSSSQTVPDGVIGQTEGTMFLDFYWEQKSGVYFIADLSDGSSNNEIYVGIGNSSDNKVRFGINNGGLSQVSFNTEVISSGNHKLAIAYANNDVACYLDSVQIATDTNSTIPSTNQFKFSRANGTLPFSGHIKQLSLYSTRLSNAELQALTQV